MNNVSYSGAAGTKSPAGIKEIAQALGVSIGTVDRALHGRSGISPLTRTRVLNMAQTLGYRPNVAARYLRLKRKMNVSVHLPREIAFFFDALQQGIVEASAPFASTVNITFRTVRRLGECEGELFREALEQKANGIIVAPGHPAELRTWIQKAARQHIPVVCVATDAPKTERLTAVAADAYTAGSMVAECLLRVVRSPSSVLIVTGDLSTVDHSEKVRGFQEFLGQGTRLSIGPIIEAHDDPGEAYTRVCECLRRDPEIRAIYVATANSLPVLRALDEAVGERSLSVITTDLFPELIPYIRDGRIVATVSQRPHTQGRMAFGALYQFLIDGTCPPARLRLAPHLVSRSNLQLELEIMASQSGNLPGMGIESYEVAGSI